MGAVGFEPTILWQGGGFKDRCVYHFHHAPEGAHQGPSLPPSRLDQRRAFSLQPRSSVSSDAEATLGLSMRISIVDHGDWRRRHVATSEKFSHTPSAENYWR